MSLTEDQRRRIMENLSDPEKVRQSLINSKRNFDERWGIDPDSPTEFIDFREIFAWSREAENSVSTRNGVADDKGKT